MIKLSNPDLGVQHELGRLDAYLRSLQDLRNYAKLNSFDAQLNRVLQQYGGKQVAELEAPESFRDKVRLKQLFPHIKRAVDKAEQVLRSQIRAGRKGEKPVVDTATYVFMGSNGRKQKFTLDPDERASKILDRFEVMLNNHPLGEQIATQFMPMFREIRRKLVAKKQYIDDKEASPQATILAIKKLCDEWAIQ